MAELKIIVCDVCGDLGRATAQYHIGRAKAPTMFDLCEEHAAPVEAVLACKEAPGAKRRTFEATVTTLEDLAARKAKAGDTTP